MEPWRVNKRYDRPISRRIVESAGVPREAFGFLKSGIFTVAIRPKHPELRVKFFEHVGKNIVPLPLLYLRIGCDRYTLRLLEKATHVAETYCDGFRGANLGCARRKYPYTSRSVRSRSATRTPR
jgi:hypothetical protein